MASPNDTTFTFDRSGDKATVYAFFNTYNYTGSQAVTSYALPFAGFTFKPQLNTVENFISRKRILWDFGDGTTAEAVTAHHAYRLPGKYTVTNFFYDREGTAYSNTYSQTVIVNNYVMDTILPTGNFTNSITLTCGRFTNPITIKRYSSYQLYEKGEPQLTIIPYASGSISDINYFDQGLHTNHYGHLYPDSSFYILSTGLSNLTGFVQVSSFVTSSTPLYCRLVGTDIVDCKQTDTGAFFCGTSGEQDIYFKSDLPSNEVNLLFGIQPDTIKEHCNTTTIGAKVKIIPNTDYTNLSITSNGIDGEGETSTTFNINVNKFSNTGISFVVRVKDSQNFTIKDIPLLENVTLSLTDGVVTYPAVFTAANLDIPTGGFYKAMCYPQTTTTLENVVIQVSTTVGGTPLTGTSNTFNIYPSGGGFNIAKKNEDEDIGARFREISFQPLFTELELLYSQFLNSIFGTISSEQTAVGKATYEKIANFVDNHAIADYANVDKLLSIFKQFNLDDIRFSSVNYRFPASISRLIDLLSIKHSKLFGAQNQFNENFNTRGYYDSTEYGINLGDEITIFDTVTAGYDIVSFEKFSGNYTKLNTFQPISASNVQSPYYQIVDYNDDWGWSLLLPESGYGNNIANYYAFYKYIPIIEGTILDGVINFNDLNTTLSFTNTSYETWSQKDGIIANILANQLYKGLNLIK